MPRSADAASCSARPGAARYRAGVSRPAELTAAIAVAVFAVAVVAGVFALARRGGPAQPTPVVVAKLDVTAQPAIRSSPRSARCGSPTEVAGDVVRVDPADAARRGAHPDQERREPLRDTRRRASCGRTTATRRRLWRIDPATNAVSGRIPLRHARRHALRPRRRARLGPRRVGRVRRSGALRLDPRTGSAAAIRPHGHGRGRGRLVHARRRRAVDAAHRRDDPAAGSADRHRAGPDPAGASRTSGSSGTSGGALLAGNGVDRGPARPQRRARDLAAARSAIGRTPRTPGTAWCGSTAARRGERDRLTAFALDDGQRVAHDRAGHVRRHRPRRGRSRGVARHRRRADRGAAPLSQPTR